MTLGIRAAAISYLLSLVFVMIIRNDTVEIDPGAKSLEGLLICTRVSYSIINSPSLTLQSNVYNGGRFSVSSTDELGASVLMTGRRFDNYGLIVFNSLCVQADCLYDIDAKEAFLNNGTMFFGFFGASTKSSNMYVTSVVSWENTGTMIFMQSPGLSTSLLIGDFQRLTRDFSITNKGVICFRNLVWLVTTPIGGDGCINVGSGSILEMHFPDFSPKPNQIINLDSSDSVLRALGLEELLDVIPVIKITGLGGGNSIEIDLPYEESISTGYCTTTGRLSLGIAHKNRVFFEVGPGYNVSDFKTQKTLVGNKITVDDPSPHEPPLACKCDTDFYSAPAANSSQVPSI
ncbi:hypothetical protein METBIDRAFT_31361 [Metschnikowia bicuspidata var. bicuspidata NRRL YB-4993]|uniref:Hyphally-regulated cell wall protein N-terminal domain-containing protein n=1 Tax=Metschnikowia bicuspidata var. bicuspidata NRRL YB-4993 TaxID=869754 RepID=A0A1A0HEY2_9ASCO|nr:hypothetical protein METBIDRAFT_31361 [Metschnikowia bicuspidata var. bicuspidata NRRL YB-4993]OBA22468.1 hypothetical protein METBIDRAFT_31361 [Metschnikowia bicuspidata var. bicuspidata NRRL YB-4993]